MITFSVPQSHMIYFCLPVIAFFDFLFTYCFTIILFKHLTSKHAVPSYFHVAVGVPVGALIGTLIILFPTTNNLDNFTQLH